MYIYTYVSDLTRVRCICNTYDSLCVSASRAFFPHRFYIQCYLHYIASGSALFFFLSLGLSFIYYIFPFFFYSASLLLSKSEWSTICAQCSALWRWREKRGFRRREEDVYIYIPVARASAGKKLAILKVRCGDDARLSKTSVMWSSAAVYIYIAAFRKHIPREWLWIFFFSCARCYIVLYISWKFLVDSVISIVERIFGSSLIDTHTLIFS